MIAVRELDDAEVYRFYGHATPPVFAGFAARRGIRTVVVGGVIVGTDGKLWGFLDHKPGYRPRAIYKYLLKFLAWAEREGIPEIYVTRDGALETSERLLSRSGFTPTGEYAIGYEIWVWKNKKVEKNDRH